MRTGKKRCIAILVYGVGACVFLEAASRLALSSDVLFNRIATSCDSYWRLLWVKRQQDRNDRVEMRYAFDIYHPTRGWALQPDLRGMRAFDNWTVSSNSHGLRGTREYAYEKPEGRRRIVVLGDSFTFGDEVSDGETYAHYLQQSLQDTEVLNLGVHGYGHDQMLIYLREEGVKYHPDMVILGFVQADMARNILTFRDFAKPKFVLRDHQLVLLNSPVPSPDSILRVEFQRLRALDVLALVGERYRWRLGQNERRVRDITVAILDEMVRTIEAVGATPVFVHLPQRTELDSGGAGGTGAETFLFAVCRKEGIPCVSLRPAFAAQAPVQALFRSHHWSPRGHMTAAAAIRAFLAQENLVPAR